MSSEGKRLKLETPDVPAIAQFLKERGIKKANALAKFARPSIRLIPRRAEMSDIGLGESRFNGDPDLPPGFEWPEFEGRKLFHLAQIDLSKFDVPELPSTGWLYLFYDRVDHLRGFDIDDPKSFRVCWIDVLREELVRTPHPVLEDPGDPCYSCQLDMRAFPSLPCNDDLELRKRSLLKWGRLVRLVEQYDLDYESAVSEFHTIAAEGHEASDHHQILGWPACIQSCLRPDCEILHQNTQIDWNSSNASKLRTRVDRDSLKSEWTLLVQLSSDEQYNSTNWVWGDVGRLYFMIRRQDLLARRFDKTWMILQCG